MGKLKVFILAAVAVIAIFLIACNIFFSCRSVRPIASSMPNSLFLDKTFVNVVLTKLKTTIRNRTNKKP